MWQELVWNVEFVRGLILLVLGIIAAMFLIPWVLKRLQAERDRRLAVELLSHWGGDCIGAMMRLIPPLFQKMKIEGYSDSLHGGGIFELWKDIQEGKREPADSATIIDNALSKAILSEGERQSEEDFEKVLEQTYPFFGGDPRVPKAMIGRIVNPMYGKLEIFEIDLLPINELEMAMSELDAMSQLGHMTIRGFLSYASQLAQAMEKFAEYLWKLKDWSNKARNKE